VLDGLCLVAGRLKTTTRGERPVERERDLVSFDNSSRSRCWAVQKAQSGSLNDNNGRAAESYARDNWSDPLLLARPSSV